MDISATWRKACSPAYPSREQIILSPSFRRARATMRRGPVSSRDGCIAGRRAGPMV